MSFKAPLQRIFMGVGVSPCGRMQAKITKTYWAEYILLHYLLKITFCFTIRLLNKGVLINILKYHHLGLRHASEIPQIKRNNILGDRIHENF